MWWESNECLFCWIFLQKKNFWPLLDGKKKLLFLLNFRVIELIFVWPYLWWLNCIFNDFFQIISIVVNSSLWSLPSYHFLFCMKINKKKTNLKTLKSNCWKERVRKWKKMWDFMSVSHFFCIYDSHSYVWKCYTHVHIWTCRGSLFLLMYFIVDYKAVTEKFF